MNFSYIALANLSLLALSIIDNGRGPAYPDILNYFGITTSTGAWIFSLATITSLLTYFFARFWLPKLGAVRSSRIGLLVLSLSSFGLALAGYTKSVTILLTASALMGPGVAAVSSTMNILVINGTKSNVRRRFLSALHAVYGLSSLMAPLILSAFIMLGFHWQEFFIASGAIPLLIVIFSLFKTERDRVVSGAWHDPSLKVPLKERMLFGLIFGCYVSSEIAVSTRLPLYLQEIHGLDVISAGNYLSGFFFFLMCGRLLFALVHFPISSRRLLILCLLSSLAVFVVGTTRYPILLPFIGFTMGPFFPTAMDLLSKIYGKQSDFMATSVLTSIGLIMSIMHIVFGQIGQAFGVNVAFSLVPLLAVMSLLALVYYCIKHPECSDAPTRSAHSS